MADADSIPKWEEANSGMMVRSSPIIPPTKALINTSSENCFQFSRNPAFEIFNVVGFMRKIPAETQFVLSILPEIACLLSIFWFYLFGSNCIDQIAAC
jgi:hypothetical protein